MTSTIWRGAPFISQNVIADLNNSSTINLDASNSYTFTGVGTSTLGVVGLQWALNTDQNATVYVEESPDNVNWDLSYDYDFIAKNGGKSGTVQATLSYWRIRVVLKENVDTTYFRLSGILCPFATPLPSSLTADRRLRTETHISDQNDRHVWVSPRNQLVAVKHTRLVGANFEGTLKNVNFWTETPINGGTVVKEGGGITLNTNTTANGSIKYTSTTRAGFVPGTSQFFIVRTTATEDYTPNNVRRIGPYDQDNGYFIQAGPEKFGIGSRFNGVDTVIEDGDFNGDYGKFVPTEINEFYIMVIEWTPNDCYWYIEGKLLHKIEGALLSGVNSLPITLENINSGGSTTQVSFKCFEAAILRQGELVTDNITYNITGDEATHNIKYGPGKLQKIIFNNTSGLSLIIYDSVTASGKTIGNITTKTSGPWLYDAAFSNGLTIVTVGNGLDATVILE